MTNTICTALMASIVIAFAVTADASSRGAVTDLRLPRFVSIDAGKAYARRGPSRTYRIDWVYQRKGLPVVITAEYEHWRRVEDHDGKGGWMHYALLSRQRTALVKSSTASMRVRPDRASPTVAVMQQDVVAQVDECTRSWCWLEKNGYEGWVSKERLWGVRPGEIIE